MTTLANSPGTMHAAAAHAPAMLGRRFVVAWPCTRRLADAAHGRTLERVACVVALQPLDLHRATIECWIEVEAVRQRTVLHATARPCTILIDGDFMHADVAAADGARLLAMTVDLRHERMTYAQSSLVHDAEHAGGAYDPPLMLTMSTERIAQSA